MIEGGFFEWSDSYLIPTVSVSLDDSDWISLDF
jgi:hypothetical protein